MQLFLEIILIKKFHADCAALKAPPCGSYLRIVTKENPKQRAACIMHPVVMSKKQWSNIELWARIKRISN